MVVRGQRAHFASTATAFNCLVAAFSSVPPVESGIVCVKSAIETGRRARFWVEDQRADKRRRVISVASKDIRSVGEVLRKRHAKIVYLMELRIRPRDDGGV